MDIKQSLEKLKNKTDKLGQGKEVPTSLEQPEIGAEKPTFRPEEGEKSGSASLEKPDESAAALATGAALQNKEVERRKQVEQVLEEGLSDIYANLNPEKQKEFRIKGEETAQKINTLLDKTKVNVGKIISLIRKWLAVIPGINKFFLEQEAKIKADKLIKIKDDKNF